jgi:hypothetical protein
MNHVECWAVASVYKLFLVQSIHEIRTKPWCCYGKEGQYSSEVCITMSLLCLLDTLNICQENDVCWINVVPLVGT